MRIFGYQLVSKWDRASNLMKMMNENSSPIKKTTQKYKYPSEKKELSRMITKHDLLQKYLPKVKSEIISKLGLSKKN